MVANMPPPQRIVVIGYRGQLGRALTAALSDRQLLALDYPEIDMTQPGIIEQVCDHRPEVVINAAAWTDVDSAEERPDACYAVNVTGVQNLALACQRSGAALLHVSTNEVFPGESGRFYREWDRPGAVSGSYSRSKEAAEAVVRNLLPGRFYITRTAWLYNNGGNNFITKIQAAADKHGALRVVADEFGSPTYAVDLAEAIVQLIDSGHYGIYHLINSGYCSRYQWAVELLGQSGRSDVPVTPISSGEWPRRTVPPPHAIILNSIGPALGITLRPWEKALAAYFEREANGTGG
ncbi:MAG: dTDP-4-dehydrorhamnose reductase [Chloroflexota bacterium]|nr:dTDP-4-dehydrorhamnose reductase [Chloroflexota bacterium]